MENFRRKLPYAIRNIEAKPHFVGYKATNRSFRSEADPQIHIICLSRDSEFLQLTSHLYKMMLDEAQYSPSTQEPFSSIDTLATPRKKKNMNKRRFSDEQIKSLESMFESESRLEARKKLQLANELGLQPRQVAIWFQNKRARWKSKQLERDYSILRSNYNSLSTRFESLKKEKQALAVQVLGYTLATLDSLLCSTYSWVVLICHYKI